MPIIAFLTPRRPSRLRAAVSDLATEVRVGWLNRRLAFIEPASVAQPATQPEPADLPDVEVIEAAAAAFAKAVDQARAADRSKRKARKVLDLLPSGMFGGWSISREPSNRMVPDLEQIRATYKRLGLGEVPMRQAAPSLKVERAAGEDASAPALRPCGKCGHPVHAGLCHLAVSR